MNKKGILGNLLGIIVVTFIVMCGVDQYFLDDAILNFIRGLF